MQPSFCAEVLYTFISHHFRLGHYIKILSALFVLPCSELKNFEPHDSGAFNVLDLPPTAPIWEGVAWGGYPPSRKNVLWITLTTCVKAHLTTLSRLKVKMVGSFKVKPCKYKYFSCTRSNILVVVPGNSRIQQKQQLK